MSLEQLSEQIISCRKCPRLVTWREEVACNKRRAYREWEYWGKPVPGFGDPQARVLVVGLAPGAHGSNRTGRMFTGDSSGEFLYAALHRAGFANQPTSHHRDDGLTLHDVFISAVCRCAPPDNKPSPGEISQCLPYLAAEIEQLKMSGALWHLEELRSSRCSGYTSELELAGRVMTSFMEHITILGIGCPGSWLLIIPAGKIPRPDG